MQNEKSQRREAVKTQKKKGAECQKKEREGFGVDGTELTGIKDVGLRRKLHRTIIRRATELQF